MITHFLVRAASCAALLDRKDVRLESALEWVFNRYFEEEFGIKGFTLSLPVKEATWLDKCKSIGPEIERAVKAYVVYAKRGEIDDAYFPYENVKSFMDLPSLNGAKYVVAGELFQSRGFHLFSDQSMLAYIQGRDEWDNCFFDLMQGQGVSRMDYRSFPQPTILSARDSTRLLSSPDISKPLSVTYRATLILSGLVTVSSNVSPSGQTYLSFVIPLYFFFG